MNNNHVSYGNVITTREGETFEPIAVPAGTEIPEGIKCILEAAAATWSLGPMDIDSIGATGYLDEVPLSLMPEGRAFGIGFDPEGRPFLAFRILTKCTRDGGTVVWKEGVWVLHQRYRDRRDIWVGASNAHGPGAWAFDGRSDQQASFDTVLAAVQGATVKLGYGREWRVKF
jgi:hypothetical protein